MADLLAYSLLHSLQENISFQIPLSFRLSLHHEESLNAFLAPWEYHSPLCHTGVLNPQLKPQPHPYLPPLYPHHHPQALPPFLQHLV